MKYPHWISASCAAVFALVVTALPLQAGPDGLDRQFEAISRLIEKADQALEAENTQEATQLYGATIAAYRDFADRFPEYRTELVQFRMSYCRNQLMGLLAAKQRNAEPPVPGLPDDIARALDEGIAFCREGRFADAETRMRELVAAHPSCAPAYLVLSTAVLGSGGKEEAKHLLERVIALDTVGSAPAHYNLAQLFVHDAAPDFEKARMHYRRAIELGAIADTNLESVLDL